jgi:hypothetical protein
MIIVTAIAIVTILNIPNFSILNAQDILSLDHMGLGDVRWILSSSM